MFHSSDRFDRLQKYSDELGKVCDQVNRELNANRRKRSDWFDSTRKWKDEWLKSHENEDSQDIDPESRKQNGPANKKKS